MPFQAFTIDESIVPQTRGGFHIPEGDYLFTCEGVTPSPEDHASEWPFLVFQLRIKAGNAAVVGQVFRHLARSNPKTFFNLGGPLQAIGGDPSAMQGRSVDTYAKFLSLAEWVKKQVVGKTFGGLVGDNEYNGRVSSQVVEFYSEDEYRSRTPYGAAAPAPAAMGMAPVPAPSTPVTDNGDTSAENDFEKEMEAALAASGATPAL